jgi:hypothetical protein
VDGRGGLGRVLLLLLGRHVDGRGGLGRVLKLNCVGGGHLSQQFKLRMDFEGLTFYCWIAYACTCKNKIINLNETHIFNFRSVTSFSQPINPSYELLLHAWPL